MAEDMRTSELSELSHASDIIPRHTPSNPYNYSGAQLAERKKCLKDLSEVYPNLPFAWLEMAYDFEKNTPREEIQKIIDDKSWEKPGKFTNENKC